MTDLRTGAGEIGQRVRHLLVQGQFELEPWHPIWSPEHHELILSGESGVTPEHHLL